VGDELDHDVHEELGKPVRILHTPREGWRQLALGADGERAQPWLRGERSRLSRPRGLQVVQLEPRAIVDDADKVVPEHRRDRGRAAPVHVRRATSISGTRRARSFVIRR
jgi:hypothetical protein